jgi:hypothetical protein
MSQAISEDQYDYNDTMRRCAADIWSIVKQLMVGNDDDGTEDTEDLELEPDDDLDDDDWGDEDREAEDWGQP